MNKIIFVILFFLVYFFSFGFAFVIFYHFKRFKPLVSLREKQILTFLFSGLVLFFLLSLFTFIFI